MSNNRLISLGGILFAGATFVAILLLIQGLAVGDTSNAEAAEWLTAKSHQTRTLVGAYLMIGGAVAFLLFLSGVVVRVQNAHAPQVLVEFIRATGLAFAGCQLIGAMAMGCAALAVRSGVEPSPIDPAALRVTALGFSIWVIPGMLSAASFAVAVACAALSAKAFPTWVGWSGLLCGLVLLGAIQFLPVMVLLLWVTAIAVGALTFQPEVRASSSGEPAS